jgi:hypothetical protein
MGALFRTVALGAFIALMGTSCASVIGIEDAERDPQLPGAGALGCDAYCFEIQALCSGPDAQFDSIESCLGFCDALTLGNEGDIGTSTIACRQRELGVATLVTEPDVHCPIAGPAGENSNEGADDTCGGACEAYCEALEATCAADFADAFGDFDSCLSDCDLLPDLGAYDASIQDGDSIQCRLYHLRAATGAPVPHCSHAAATGPGAAQCQ